MFTIEDIAQCVEDSYLYNSLDKVNSIVRRAAFYLHLKYRKRVVRRVHFDNGRYEERVSHIWTDDDIAKAIRAVRKYMRSSKDV